MAYETLLVETDGPVGVITLNRPKALNAANRRVTEARQNTQHRLHEKSSARLFAG